MSYILDALRKSEKERQAGQVPGLPNLVSEGAKPASRWLVWLVVLLLLINLSGLAYWFYLKTHQDQAPEAASAVTGANPAGAATAAVRADQSISTPVVNSGVPPEPTIPPAPVLSTAVPVQPPAAAVVRSESAELAAPAPATPVIPAPVQVTPQIQPESTPLVPPVARSTPSAPAPRSGELPYFPPQNLPDTRTPQGRVPAAQDEDFDDLDAEMEAESERLASGSGRSIEAEPDAASVQHGLRPGTPHLRDLPVEFQEQVPPFKITMFAYSKNPAERFVIIDMKKLRVGDRLPGGILLLEIQSENLVLELDGQKFQIPRY